jgi:hypothetical protein
MVQQRKPQPDTVNGVPKRDPSSMSFQKKDAADTRSLSGGQGKGDGKIQNGAFTIAAGLANFAYIPWTGNRSGNFRTDTAISNSRNAGERVLQRWNPGPNTPEVDGSLEKSSNNAKWDQFAENQRLFGVQTTYDERYYTTAIDKSRPDHKDRLAHADKIAKEIERSVASTSHVAEERVMDFAGSKDQGGDEEDKYAVTLCAHEVCVLNLLQQVQWRPSPTGLRSFRPRQQIYAPGAAGTDRSGNSDGCTRRSSHYLISDQGIARNQEAAHDEARGLETTDTSS